MSKTWKEAYWNVSRFTAHLFHMYVIFQLSVKELCGVCVFCSFQECYITLADVWIPTSQNYVFFTLQWRTIVAVGIQKNEASKRFILPQSTRLCLNNFKTVLFCHVHIFMGLLLLCEGGWTNLLFALCMQWKTNHLGLCAWISYNYLWFCTDGYRGMQFLIKNINWLFKVKDLWCVTLLAFCRWKKFLITIFIQQSNCLWLLSKPIYHEKLNNYWF